MPHEVLVPPLGQTVDTVTLVTWYKGEGDVVREGELLFAIETDKATLDIEAQASGVLRRVTASEGDDVQALSAIALIVGPEEDGPEMEVTGQEVTEKQSAGGLSPPLDRATPGVGRPRASIMERLFVSPRARRLAEAESVPLESLSGTGPEGAIVARDVRAYLERQARRTITPVAERMAKEASLDWRQVQGSGPGGRVTKEDVAAAIGEAPGAEAPVAPVAEGITATAAREAQGGRPFNEPSVERPLEGIRAIIAERMAESTSRTARVTLMAEADASAMVALREQVTADGFAVSYNDLLLYVLGRALREHPALNASLEDHVVRQWKRIHVGLAVDTDRGLLVPVLRDVDEKRLEQLSQDTRDLIERVRTNKLRPEELTGGTFTLTNLGVFGIDAFTPIINLPETAILGVGRIKARPVAEGEQVVVRPMAWLCLTFDHRMVDGAPAARFFQRVVQLIEHPHLMHV